MPAPKVELPSDGRIHPDLTYRVNHPLAVGATGLAPEQQKQAAERGELAGEKPFRLTPHGPWAWLGLQLLHINEDRLARSRGAYTPPTKSTRKRRAA